MNTSPSNNYNSPSQEITSLKEQIQQLSNTLSTPERISDFELESAVNRLSTLGKDVLQEYSKNRELSEMKDLMSDMKNVIQQASAVLNHTGTNKTHQKIQIVFASRIPTLQANVLPDMPSKLKQEIAFTKSLINSLHQLENQIHDVEQYGQIVEHFTKNSSFPEKLTIYKQKFIKHIFSFLLKKASIIFAGHLEKVRHEKSIKELAASKKSHIKLMKQLEILKNKKASFINKSFFNNLKIKSLEKNIKKTGNQLIKVESKIVFLSRRIESSESDIKKGRETRDNFHVLGGNNVKIALESENTTLDGTYVSCDAFRKALKDGGAKKYQLTFQPTQSMTQNGDKPFELNGILFPPGTQGNIVDRALTSLGAFKTADKTGAGWEKLRLEDGSIVLITEEESEKLKRLNITQGDFLSRSSSWGYQIQQEELDTNQSGDGGTVILTSGSGGVYEMHKKEILAFLMRGMNVLAFNFRGYGESTGTPTGEGLNRDMEAAYQYIKQKHQVPDEKILLKALCLSGGPAVHLASQHPEVNLFLDQSYADFGNLAKRGVDKEIDEFVEKAKLDKSVFVTLKAWWFQMKRPFFHAMAVMLTPNWIVKNEIGKIQGHVGIMHTRGDDIIDLNNDVGSNYKAALKENQAKSVSIMAMEGKHADSWLNSRSKGDLITFIKPEKLNGLLVEISEADKEIFNDSYKLILRRHKQFQLSLAELSEQIELAINKVSQEKKESLRNFLNKAILVGVDVLNDPNFQQSYFEGRLQMDNFLNKSGLRGSL